MRIQGIQGNDCHVKIKITQADSATGTAKVEFDYNGVVKTYRVVFTNN